MKMLLSALVVCLLVVPNLARGQAKKTGRPAAKPAPSLQELVQEGRIVEAVRSAIKSPNAVGNTVRKLLDTADASVGERQIAEADATLKNTSKFLDAYEKSARRTTVPREPLKGRQLRLEGIKLIDSKDYTKAVAVLSEALEISKKTKDPTLEAGTHNNLGVALQSQGKLEEAKTEFEAASRLADLQKDSFRAGSSTFNLGMVQIQLKQFEPALESFRRSETQFNAASRAVLEARAVLMQGVTLGKINSVSPEALKYFERAQKMFELAGDKRNAGWSFYLMGDHIAYGQKFAEAAVFGERAIPFLTAAGDKTGLLQCYQFLVDMYERMGKKDQAEKYRKLAAEQSKS